jgi:DNA-binding response OmpR family regulator
MGERERILVVEDDQDLCSLLCELLTSESYRTEAVHSGGAAVEKVNSWKPDAVVLDVMLPEMNGFEVCRKLKFRRDTNLIPVVMLTALDNQESRNYGLRVGANRYLTKPFEPVLLLDTLRNVLDRRADVLKGKTKTAVEIQMQSDSRYLEQLNDMLSELFVLTPLSEVEINRIRYAVLEMVENAIEWGNKRQPNLMVGLSYEVTEDKVRFTITDEGKGFNPTTLPHAATSEDPLSHLDLRAKLGLRDGGFGILIAKGMVDKLEYNEKGNQCTLTKYFGKPGAPPAAPAS